MKEQLDLKAENDHPDNDNNVNTEKELKETSSQNDEKQDGAYSDSKSNVIEKSEATVSSTSESKIDTKNTDHVEDSADVDNGVVSTSTKDNDAEPETSGEAASSSSAGCSSVSSSSSSSGVSSEAASSTSSGSGDTAASSVSAGSSQSSGSSSGRGSGPSGSGEPGSSGVRLFSVIPLPRVLPRTRRKKTAEGAEKLKWMGPGALQIFLTTR